MTLNTFITNNDFEDFEGNECIIFSYDHEYETLIVDYRNKSENHLHINFSFDNTDCKNLYHYLKNIYELNESKITKSLKDFTEDELNDICHHHDNCKKCPLSFLTENIPGRWCPIPRDHSFLKENDIFFNNYDKAKDKKITVKTTDFWDNYNPAERKKSNLE